MNPLASPKRRALIDAIASIIGRGGKAAMPPAAPRTCIHLRSEHRTAALRLVVPRGDICIPFLFIVASLRQFVSAPAVDNDPYGLLYHFTRETMLSVREEWGISSDMYRARTSPRKFKCTRSCLAAVSRVTLLCFSCRRSTIPSKKSSVRRPFHFGRAKIDHERRVGSRSKFGTWS